MAVGSAHAALMTYTIQGTGTGELGGRSFSNASFTISMVGDTGAYDGLAVDPLASSTVTIAGLGSTTLLIGTRLGYSSADHTAFFSREGTYSRDLFDFFVTSDLDLTTPFARTLGYEVFGLDQFNGVDSSKGALSLSSSSDIWFCASAAVPEPGTASLAAFGLLALGGFLRRRAASSVNRR